MTACMATALAQISIPLRSVVMLTMDRSIDRRIILEAESLEDAGWQVTIIAMSPDTPADDHPRVIRLGTSDKGRIPARESWVLGIYKWMRQHVPMDGPLMRRLKAWSWRYVVDQEKFFIRLFAPAAMQYSPTVFMAHDLPMLAVAKGAAQHCGAKLVYDSHELYSEQELSARVKRRWSDIEGKHIGACDAVITVNPSIAQELQRRYDLEIVNVVYNAERTGFETSRRWYFHELYELQPTDKVLLFQGGVSAGRHIDTLVASMRLVENKDIHLVVLGDGQLVQLLTKIAEDEGITQRVHFHAAVPQQDLLMLTVSADAGIIPYQATCLNNYYCTPNKLFEFIATGLPVLGSDLPEIRRIVTSNEIGQVADLSTRENMAAAIDDFFSDESRFQGWRKNVQTARQTVSWEQEGKKIMEIFEGL